MLLPTTQYNHPPFTNGASGVLTSLDKSFGDDSVYCRDFSNGVQHPGYSDTVRGLAILRAAQEEIQGGYFFHIRQLVAAELFDSFLEQAEYLLASGYKDAAAVLIGPPFIR